MVFDTRSTSPDRSSGIKSIKGNYCKYSAQEGVRVYALQQIKKATNACNQLTDPSTADALHNFRVAVRRLRTWIRAFKRYHNVSRKTRKHLGEITDSTNKSRDLEVFRNWLNMYVSEIVSMPPDDREALDNLFKHITNDYERELAGINNHVPKDWKKLNASLIKHLNSNIKAEKTEIRLANVAGDKVLEICKTVDDQLPLIHGIDDRMVIHKLRIYFKHLRYLLEPFRYQLLALNEVISFLKKIQDILGNFRDAQITIELLSAYHNTLPDTLSDASGKAKGKEIIFNNLLEHARRQELDMFDRFRNLYINGEIQRIIHEIRITAEKMRIL